MLTFLLACEDDVELHQVPPDPDETAPLIQLEPHTLSFDALTMGTSAELPLIVSNIGATTLEVSSLTITGTSAFTQVDEASTLSIEPGASTTINIQFSPLNPEDVGTLEVASNDPFEPVATAVLAGAAAVPELRVHPNPLRFGDVPEGCALTRSLTLENVGVSDLVVDAIAADTAGFSVASPTLPLTIAPGEEASVDATYRPIGPGPSAGAIFVASNDLAGFTAVSTEGAGGGALALEDTFQQGDQVFEQTDILLYVDGSGSMVDDQENLADNFGQFVEALGEAALDWRMIVVTRDDGCHNGPVFSVENVNTLDVLDAVQGQAGDQTEAGLSLSFLALSKVDACNDDWLREDARTTLILVSDEAEQSSEPAAERVDDILTLAPTATIHAIVGDVPDGCPTAEAGVGYEEAAALTGGAFLSICDADWGAYFQTIADRTASNQVDTFPLTAFPDPASIEVEVNGAAAAGWAYDADLNAVVFEEDRWPPPSALIRVAYASAAVCD